MTKLLIFLIFTLVSTNSMAEWTRIDWSDEKILYVDFDSIRTRKAENRIVKMWSLNDYLRRKDGMLSEIALSDFDCDEETMKLLNLTKFSGKMGSGKVIGKYNYSSLPEEWEPVSPGSLGEVLWKAACSNYK